MKHFYAEQAVMGCDRHTVIKFDSKAERDEYVKTTDYTNAISAAEIKDAGKIGSNLGAPLTLAEFNARF